MHRSFLSYAVMVDSALPTALWLTYTLYLGLLCGFGLWWLLPELWEHLTPVSVPMDVARHVNLRVRLIFVGPDDETLAILAPLALRRAAVARLRLALRDDEPGGVVRWQVSASKKLGGLPPVGNEEALQQPETRAALRFHVLLQPLHARRGSCRCGMATLADDARLGWVRVEAGSSDGVVACVSNASGALDALARTLRTELGSRSRMLAQTDPAHVLRPMGRVSMSLLQPGAAPTAERRHERSVRSAASSRAPRHGWPGVMANAALLKGGVASAPRPCPSCCDTQSPAGSGASGSSSRSRYVPPCACMSANLSKSW